MIIILGAQLFMVTGKAIGCPAASSSSIDSVSAIMRVVFLLMLISIIVVVDIVPSSASFPELAVEINIFDDTADMAMIS